MAMDTNDIQMKHLLAKKRQRSGHVEHHMQGHELTVLEDIHPATREQTALYRATLRPIWTAMTAPIIMSTPWKAILKPRS